MTWRGRAVGLLLVLVVVLGAAWLWHEKRRVEEAYVAQPRVTLWSGLGQVRQSVGELSYGARVTVLERRKENARVLGPAGEKGWLSEQSLMAPGLWGQISELQERVRGLPVQARGRTGAISNLRLAPGRDQPRVFQLRSGATVEILGRAVADRPAQAEPGASLPHSQDPRREDWLLVRARPDGMREMSGWILGRFVQLDLPPPLRDLGAGIRWMAYFELSRVPTEAGDVPQYLGAGVAGGEGQPCDFTLLRVFTWDTLRHRYETAYVESNFCGRLPIQVGSDRGQPVFWFTNVRKAGEEERRYRMRGAIVRREAAPRS